MIRRLITALAALILRVFFRRVEVIGLHRVPEQGAVMFVLNHPSGLIDPLFILTLAPRPVTFLGKATLFSMPVIGWFVRGIDAIPVYRPQDAGATVEENRITFEKTRQLLSEGKSIAMFPEGTSHSDPHLKPLKSGAARIALGARLERLWIVPAGLYYTSKGVFRSSVLLLFGEPFALTPEASPADAASPEASSVDGEPSREAVQKLTERIRQALSDVLLQAENPETLSLVERAEAIYSGANPGAGTGRAPPPSLRQRFERRRLFMEHYRGLKESNPAELAALEQRLREFDRELTAKGLTTADLGGRFDPRGALGLALLVLALPLSAAGVVIHYPAYRLVGYLSKRLSKEDEDLVATIKVLGAMLFFPLSWAAAAFLAAERARGGAGVATAVFLLSPVAGYAALLSVEHLEGVRRRLRGLRCAWLRPETQARLRAERLAIYHRIRALGGGGGQAT